MTTASTPSSMTETKTTTDPLRLMDVDHLRFFVGNAKQSAYFYAHTFGFSVSQFSDLTTGSRDSASYLLTQGNIRLVLTTGLHKDHPAQQEVAHHGDGVKDIAFTVRDATAAYEQALRNGGESAYEPFELRSDAGDGAVTMAGIKIYGRCVHSFVSRSGIYGLEKMQAGGPFLPGFTDRKNFSLNDYNREHPHVDDRHEDHHRSAPPDGRRSPAVLRRQRQAVGVFLRALLRVHRLAVFRSHDGISRQRQLPAHAGQHSPAADDRSAQGPSGPEG